MNSSIVSNTLNMPAEWKKHEATWLSWPNDDDFFKEKIGNVEKLYVEIISHLHKGEYVKIVVLNQDVEDLVRRTDLEEETILDVMRILKEEFNA